MKKAELRRAIEEISIKVNILADDVDAEVEGEAHEEGDNIYWEIVGESLNEMVETIDKITSLK
jgi:hypothetical protein